MLSASRLKALNMIHHSTQSNDYLWSMTLCGERKKLQHPNTKFLAIFNGRNNKGKFLKMTIYSSHPWTNNKRSLSPRSKKNANFRSEVLKIFWPYKRINHQFCTFFRCIARQLRSFCIEMQKYFKIWGLYPRMNEIWQMFYDTVYYSFLKKVAVFRAK